MTRSKLMIVLAILFTSCSSDNKNEIAKWKQEIVDTEHAFAEMAKTDGIPKAFTTFAAEDVVLLREGNLIKGKVELKESYAKKIPSGNETLTWSPDFVDVSSSGDLGYTYGKYTYNSTDSAGNVVSNEGIFHTVWKRQPDGTWKFVWD
jgi:ketosteroid isomerase-like protein